MGYKKALANLSVDAVTVAVDAADRVHRILMRSAIGAVVVSLGLNFSGLKFGNIILLIVLNIFFLYVCRKPSVSIDIFLAGVVAKKVVKGLDLFRLWLDESNAAIFLASFYLLIVGIFRFNFISAAIIIGALSVLYNRKKHYNVSSKFLKNFSGILSAVVIAICLILAVPREAYAKYIGFDLAGMLRVSDTEKTISDTNIKLEKVKGKRDQIELKKAQDELDQLSNNPQALEDPASEEKIQKIQNRIKAIEEKPEYRSNPGKVKGVFSSKSSPKVSKQWETVFSQTYTGKGVDGDNFIKTVQMGNELRRGDKIIISGKTFLVLCGEWEKHDGRTEIVNQAPDDGKFLYIAAEKDIPVTVEIQRLVQPAKRNDLVTLANFSTK